MLPQASLARIGSNVRFGSQPRKSGYFKGIGVRGYELRTTDYRIRDTAYGLQNTEQQQWPCLS